MKVNELDNLFVAVNKSEDFNILIFATDQIQAEAIAKEYSIDAGLDDCWEISPFRDHDIDMRFNCSCVISFC